jgi:putative transposase
LDESGFCTWSEPGYTYYQRGEQKRLEQTLRRGRRLSIIGFLQPLISFVYGLVIGGVDRKSYIQMMELEAQEAEKIGRITVIVQDNGPIHRCHEVQQLWSSWESQGLYIFFLPKYCSEMNPIELEWQHLKNDELAGKMFDDELDLAYAVIDGVQARGERGNYSTQRVKFNSNRSS